MLQPRFLISAWPLPFFSLSLEDSFRIIPSQLLIKVDDLLMFDLILLTDFYIDEMHDSVKNCWFWLIVHQYQWFHEFHVTRLTRPSHIPIQCKSRFGFPLATQPRKESIEEQLQEWVGCCYTSRFRWGAVAAVRHHLPVSRPTSRVSLQESSKVSLESA